MTIRRRPVDDPQDAWARMIRQAIVTTECSAQDSARLNAAVAKLRGIDSPVPESHWQERSAVTAVVNSAEPATGFDSACAAIRTRIREDERYLVRELFAISDMVAEAERLFDPATPVVMPPGT